MVSREFFLLTGKPCGAFTGGHRYRYDGPRIYPADAGRVRYGRFLYCPVPEEIEDGKNRYQVDDLK